MTDKAEPNSLEYFMTRTKFVQAMKETSEYPDLSGTGDADLNIGLEVLGQYIAHNTVTRMVAEGKLDKKAGVMLNATIGCHAFTSLHACTHGGVAMGNPEHESFEAMVFRTASLIAKFNDGYMEQHKMHHSRCNNPELDTDYGLAHSTIAELGGGMAIQSQLETKALVRSLRGDPGHYFNWDAQVVDILAAEVLKMMRKDGSPYKAYGDTALLTQRQSAAITSLILGLFFGRYPHRGAINGQDNEVDSYYDTTYRGQGQVDLWMMGEGWHHGHHARNDVNYSRLPRVGLEVERDHPELREQFRGNGDSELITAKMEPAQLSDLELPPLMADGDDDAPPDQAPYERTVRVRVALKGLYADPARAMEEAALATIDNALRVATDADFALLRHLHGLMGMPDGEFEFGSVRQADVYGEEMRMGALAETLFSEANQRAIGAAAGAVRAEVGAMGRRAGAESAKYVERGADWREFERGFIHFFRGVADAFATPAEQRAFCASIAAHLGIPAAATRRDQEQVWEQVHVFLRRPLPREITLPGRVARGAGDIMSPVRTIASFFADPAAFVPTEFPEPSTELDKFVLGAYHMLQAHKAKEAEEKAKAGAEEGAQVAAAAGARSKL